MGLFSSDRERRLWAATGLVVVAIYATLGVAQSLAQALRGTGFGEGLFALCCLLVLVTLVTQGLTQWPGKIEIGVALGIATTYLLVFARTAVPTERSHLIEYGVVALFIYEALTERVRQGRSVPLPALLSILATSLLGLIDEGIQSLLPNRVFDPRDLLFNALASAMAVVSQFMLRAARRKKVKR